MNLDIVTRHTCTAFCGQLLISAVSCLTARVVSGRSLMATQDVLEWAVRRAGPVMLTRQQHFGALRVCLESEVCDAYLGQIPFQTAIDCDDVNGAMMSASSENTRDIYANLLGLIT